jgi:hypothetical protein
MSSRLQLLHGRAETIREFLRRSYNFSIRVQGALNVDPQGAQRAFDQILHAALRIGHRGGLVNAQRFLEQINRLIAHAVERLALLSLLANQPFMSKMFNAFAKHDHAKPTKGKTTGK